MVAVISQLTIFCLTQYNTFILNQKWDLNQMVKEDLSHHFSTRQDTSSGLQLGIIRIIEALNEHEKSKELRLTWNTAMRRIDLFLMTTFIFLNLVVTVCILIHGFQSLVK